MLHPETDSLIALGLNGRNFAEHAAAKLLSLNNCYGEVRRHLLVSCLRRHDKTRAKQFLVDWTKEDLKPKINVSKFIPGEHYHVLNTKFDTLDDAINYLNAKGYQYAGLTETHVYKPD